MCRLWLLVPVLVAALAPPAPAGIFRKSPRPDPAQRVPALLQVLKDDPDERKRADAAEELRDYDLKAFPEMMPALIDALQNDPSTSVRATAANTIGKLRPISQQAGYALEEALQNDSAWRVRVAARTTLWQYSLLGYRSERPREQSPEQTDEPPLADPPVVPGRANGSQATGRPGPAAKPEPAARSILGLNWGLFRRDPQPAVRMPAPEPTEPAKPARSAEKPPLLLPRTAERPVGANRQSAPNVPRLQPDPEGPLLTPPK